MTPNDAGGKSARQRLSLPGASLSALAVERGGEVVSAHRPDHVALPASNTKLVTAALALDTFGPDYRFETPALARGTLDRRDLDGDLVVRGSGDPSIEVADLAALAATVAERVDRVGGDLVLDTSLFSGPRFGPGRTWADGRHAYGAPTGALSLESNCVTVSVTAEGERATVDVTPDAAPVTTEVDLTVDTDADGADVSVTTDQRTRTLSLTGRASPEASATERAPVVSPAEYAGAVFGAALADVGVAVEGSIVVEGADAHGSDTSTERLGEITSPPLQALLREMNVPSDNTIADHLARNVAARNRDEGSWEDWRDLVADRFDAFGIETVRVTDGSGMSRYNRVSARGIVALLSWAADRPWADALFGSLPAPGEGTLASRLDGVPVRAKTGTLTGARALSGRIEREGSDVLFSVLHDDLTVRADEARDLQDEWVRSLVD